MSGPGKYGLMLAVLLYGCAGGWMKVSSSNSVYQGAHYTVSMPTGWMRIESEGKLLLAKDGPDLQRILIQYRGHDEAFEELERQSSAAMLPSELAELALAELKASQEGGLPSLRVVSNAPLEIAGRQGFALHLVYKTDAGLRMEMLVRGFVTDNGFYQLSYRAPSLHYFGRDRAAFESLSRSLRL